MFRILKKTLPFFSISRETDETARHAPVYTRGKEVTLSCGVTHMKNDELVGTSKPYFKVKHSDRELYNNMNEATKMKKKNGLGWKIWGEQKFTIPNSISEITIEIWDEDFGKDDFMGSVNLSTEFPKGKHQLTLKDEKIGYFAGLVCCHTSVLTADFFVLNLCCVK